MKYLIVVDIQNDFISGSLGTKEACNMLPNLLNKVKEFDGNIILTKDTHKENYMESQEGKFLPVTHCIKGTEGWNSPKEFEKIVTEKSAKAYEKNAFGSMELINDLSSLYNKSELESVEIIGLCTDICVISIALTIKSVMPELPIYVDSSCCAGITPEKHNEALDVMKSCQIIVK